jgi:two-component system alkaline phosphatase synthesis response regulator PhoP
MTRILIVEDEPKMVAGLRDNFEYEGYEVLTAHDGLEGLDRALATSPDLVVLDVMMPKMDGFELTRRLREDEATSKMPIILLTARSQEADVQRGFDAGADDYIRKPFSPQELRARVQAILGRR